MKASEGIGNSPKRRRIEAGSGAVEEEKEHDMYEFLGENYRKTVGSLLWWPFEGGFHVEVL